MCFFGSVNRRSVLVRKKLVSCAAGSQMLGNSQHGARDSVALPTRCLDRADAVLTKKTGGERARSSTRQPRHGRDQSAERRSSGRLSDRDRSDGNSGLIDAVAPPSIDGLSTRADISVRETSPERECSDE